MFLKFLTIISISFSSYIFSEQKNDSFKQIAIPTAKAVSEQVDLFVNVDKIDDGGVFFIIKFSKKSYVWDIPNCDYSLNVTPILYSLHGFGNQRFIIREQAEFDGKMYYTISPLYAPDLTLSVNSNNENYELKIGEDKNTSLINFMTNKFIIEKSTYGYTITTGVSNFTKYLTPNSNTLTEGTTITHKTLSSTSNMVCQWEICKTDTLGLDLQNKIYINGRQNQYFNLTPPSTCEYIIETQKCGSDNVDTYLELYDGNNTLLASNDDISYENRFSQIIYNFNSLDDVQVVVRGYSGASNGYVYLTLRPKNALYFAGVYDFDKNNNDRPESLKKAKQFMPNYYIEVQSNRGKNSILEFSPSGKRKIDSEYFVFSGHGYSNASGVAFYNGVEHESFCWDEIPNISNCQIAIWLSCHGARNYFKDSTFNEMTSMAYQSICCGAEYSLGWVGEIYDTTQRGFPKRFFEYINEGSTISMAVNQAVYRVINDNWWWWTFFGQSNDDFASPILYENGDALRLTCGNGNYENSKSLNNERSKFNGVVINNTSSGDIFLKDTFDKSLSSMFPYRFRTIYKNKIYDLGFNCDKNNHKVSYFNLTDNSYITDYEFERLMGVPCERIYKLFGTVNK